MLKIKGSQDSTAYYSKLAYSNIQLNKFKTRSLHSKAIDYAEERNRSTSNSNTILRKIYFDLEKNNDAIETFSKVSLFESISPTATYAETYYLGLTEMQKLNYKRLKFILTKQKLFINF
jgi:hypothetical protein